MTIQPGVVVYEGTKVISGPAFTKENQRSLTEHRIIQSQSSYSLDGNLMKTIEPKKENEDPYR